jgi:glycosyltransferase involved in cell wall biosynthesis
MKKKICLIMQDICTIGGVQTVVSTTANYLVSCGDYEITIISPNERGCENPYDLSENVKIISRRRIFQPGFFLKNLRRIYFKFKSKIIRIKWPKMSLLVKHIEFPEKYLRELSAYLSRENFDVVFGVGAEHAVLLGLLTKYYHGKTVGWMHATSDSYFFGERSSASGMYELARDVFPKLDKIFVLTHADKCEYDKEFSVNSVVLPNPFSVGACKCSSQETGCLIWAGRLAERVKGTDFLVRIFRIIHEQVPDCRLLVVGDGADRERLRSQWEEAELLDAVDMYGRVDNEVLMQELYAKSDIALNTSRTEGFGMTIVEAGACGVPTVAFANSGPAEILENGVSGILIPPYDVEAFADETLRLMKNREERLKMAENIQEKIKEYSVENIVQSMFAEIEE